VFVVVEDAELQVFPSVLKALLYHIITDCVHSVAADLVNVAQDSGMAVLCVSQYHEYVKKKIYTRVE
jgi:hypothetical protein